MDLGRVGVLNDIYEKDEKNRKRKENIYDAIELVPLSHPRC